jgi:hypothetical protein
MKVLLKTAGSFSLYDPDSLQPVNKDRPYIVDSSNFFHQRLGLGQLKVVAEDWPDHATDAGWAAVLKACDGDIEMAIAAYKAELTPPAEDEKLETLLGSSKLPAIIDLPDGTKLQLGTLVCEAHKESGLSAEEWNVLADEVREEKLAAYLEKLAAHPKRETKAERKAREKAEKEAAEKAAVEEAAKKAAEGNPGA